MEQIFITLTMFDGFVVIMRFGGEDDCKSNEKRFSIGKMYNQFHAISMLMFTLFI